METTMFSHMFNLALPVLEKILRPILVYFFLIIGLRLSGKRELGQLNTFDLVVLLTLSNTVQNAIIGEDNSLTGGIIGAATLLLTNFLVVRYVHLHPKIEEIVEGGEVLLISSGRIRPERLKRESISMEELTVAAHRAGFTALEEVLNAILEPDGAITFFGRHAVSEKKRQQEILERLDRIEVRLAENRPAVG